MFLSHFSALPAAGADIPATCVYSNAIACFLLLQRSIRFQRAVLARRCNRDLIQNRYDTPICITGYQRKRDISRCNSCRPFVAIRWLFTGPTFAANCGDKV